MYETVATGDLSELYKHLPAWGLWALNYSAHTWEACELLGARGRGRGEVGVASVAVASLTRANSRFCSLALSAGQCELVNGCIIFKGKGGLK